MPALCPIWLIRPKASRDVRRSHMFLHARLLLHVPTPPPFIRKIQIQSFFTLPLLPSQILQSQWTRIGAVEIRVRRRLSYALLESRGQWEIEEAIQIPTRPPLTAGAVGHLTDVHPRRTKERDPGRRHSCYTRHWAGLAAQVYSHGGKSMILGSRGKMAGSERYHTNRNYSVFRLSFYKFAVDVKSFPRSHSIDFRAFSHDFWQPLWLSRNPSSHPQIRGKTRPARPTLSLKKRRSWWAYEWYDAWRDSQHSPHVSISYFTPRELWWWWHQRFGYSGIEVQRYTRILAWGPCHKSTFNVGNCHAWLSQNE